MKNPTPTIRVNVDCCNPGQYFACCGLLELAERLWPGAVGWFETGSFCITCTGDLPSLISAILAAEFKQLDLEDDTGSPIEIGRPFRPLRLDWWQDELHSERKLQGKELKVWAGTMESYRIALAMRLAMKDERFRGAQLFNVGLIAYDPADASKKVEPYYFDARRGPNAHSRDVGFSPNDLCMTTTAFPAVELLCLIGLQSARPAITAEPRIYDYFTWSTALPTNLLLAASTGTLEQPGQKGYRFENWYRTGQKKHKAFRAALPLNERR